MYLLSVSFMCQEGYIYYIIQFSQYLVVGTDLLMTVFVELYADLSEFWEMGIQWPNMSHWVGNGFLSSITHGDQFKPLTT